jgi:hypothetical protein
MGNELMNDSLVLVGSGIQHFGMNWRESSSHHHFIFCILIGNIDGGMMQNIQN